MESSVHQHSPNERLSCKSLMHTEAFGGLVKLGPPLDDIFDLCFLSAWSAQSCFFKAAKTTA
jgi:hypothetical protein